MYKAVILHTDRKQSILLKNIVQEHCAQIDCVGDHSRLTEIDKWISKLNPHLIFVLFSDKDFKNFHPVIEKQRTSGREIIVMAESNQYAYKLISLNLVDFILLPGKIHEIKSSVAKFINRAIEQQVNKQMALIIKSITAGKNNHSQKIAVPTQDGFVFIKMEDIIHCEANGAYTYIYTSRKEKIIASRNIKEYEEVLPKEIFFRIHNSHLVNINRISKYNKGRGGSVTMEDGTQIEVASRRRTEFLNMFQ